MQTECSPSIGQTCIENGTSAKSDDTTLSQSMSSVADSPVKIFPTQDSEQDFAGSEADCGLSSRGSFARWCRHSLSLKTYQRCLIEDWIGFSGALPTSGTMRSGMLFQRRPLVLCTDESESGLLPTPRASDGLAHKIRSAESVRLACIKAKRSRPSRLEDWLALEGGTGGVANPQWLAWFMGFPHDWLIDQTDVVETPSFHRSQNGSDNE